ncbi:MAG TPA: DNA-processing protein DprA [Actinomycetota bacterium]|nr:DNA-processing protein DprA [Actinomycetota bacterium]
MTTELRPGGPGWPVLLDELGPVRRPGRLYVRGLPIPARPLIAVVGARRPTVAGLDATRTLATGLVEAGYGIVSGLAMGIDAAAHEAALAAGGYTIGVLGFGLDVTYPRRNARLKQRIGRDGTLVTEFPAGTDARAAHFPQRNRIIAGLAVATVVVEGGIKSGALITARFALDANRAVFAVPGSFRNTVSAGSNELIRRHEAVLVTEVGHIFDELAPGAVWDGPVRLSLEPHEVRLDADEELVLMLLDDAPATPDRLCRELGLGAGAVALALSRLDVRGLVLRKGNGYEITTAGARARAAVATREKAC